MSLEEKFEALLKSYQTVLSSNQELKRQNDYMTHTNQGLKHQNEYLRRQLGEAMKMKQKALESPSASNYEDISEAESQHFEFKDEAELRWMPRRE